MATYNIKAMYEYEGEVEAATEEEALSYFYNNLNDYYVSTESEETTKLGECVVCGEVDSDTEEDFTCELCTEDEEDEGEDG